MLPVFLASVTPYAGKNVVALGLAQKLQDQNKSVGYFKPIGPLPVTAEGQVADEDAVFFKRVLGLSEPLETLCPLVLTAETIADLLRRAEVDMKEQILSAFRSASASKDFVITVTMGRLSCGLTWGYPMHDFVRDVKAKLIVVDRYRWPVETLDGILHMKNMLGEHFAGVVFNRVPNSKMSQVNEAVRPFLEAHGVAVFGVVKEDKILGALPVSEIVEALNGKVLCAGKRLDRLVERVCIGAMKAQAALRIFQRNPNKAVITGGDRPDIQLAALQTSTRCIVLTGNLYPNERILTRAEELGVPVILVAQDTATTAEACERLHGHLSLHSDRKIARAREVLDEAMDWDALYKSLGIS